MSSLQKEGGVEELYMFLGCALDGNEITTKDGLADAEILKNHDTLKLNTDFEDVLMSLEAMVV
jgi:hypothetical protein